MCLMIKLIACDLDGTALDDQKNIDSGLKEVIGKLKEKGILFTVASGRNKELIRRFVEDLEIEIPYICNNGANIYHGNELINVDCIPSEHVSDIARLLYEKGVVFRVYSIEDVFCNKISDFFLARTKGFTKPFKDYSPEIDLSKYHVVKIAGDFNDCEEIIEDVQKIVRAYPGTDFFRVEPDVYCVNSISANKGDSLKKVCDNLGIEMGKEVMSFGDNENDLSMLKGSKISVAMGNSEENVKEEADYICLDNNHNGVSEFLKEYFKEILIN